MSSNGIKPGVIIVRADGTEVQAEVQYDGQANDGCTVFEVITEMEPGDRLKVTSVPRISLPLARGAR